MTKQLCPLCDQEADYETVINLDGKLFTCPLCTKFFIDSSSEAHISGLPEVTRSEARKKLSDMAKACPSDHVFVIREPKNDERGGDGQGVARTQMIAQYLSNDRL